MAELATCLCLCPKAEKPNLACSFNSVYEKSRSRIEQVASTRAEYVELTELSVDRPMGLFDQCIVSTLLYLLLDFIRVLMSTESYQR